MRLDVRNVRRRFSAIATVLVVMSLLLGTLGAMSVLAVDSYGSMLREAPVAFDAEAR